MHVVLTICSAVILVLCAWGFVLVRNKVDECHGWFLKVEATALKLQSERARVTVLERELESLRRELRKLSGKFYADLRAREEDIAAQDEYLDSNGAALDGDSPFQPPGLVACENWRRAQSDGPHSEAASCECDYCVRKRTERRALRAALVPKTVQGQAELAKLNAGKP